MVKKIDEKNDRSRILDTPWIHSQVDSHLFFGILAKKLKLRYIIYPLILIWIIGMLIYSFIQSLIIIPTFLYVLYFLNKAKRFTRLAIGWLATKCTITLVSFLFIIVAFPSSLKNNQSDAIPNLLLGLLWFPFIDFIPKVTKNQKYLTICRIILTIPIIYYGIRSGHWHWD